MLSADYLPWVSASGARVGCGRCCGLVEDDKTIPPLLSLLRERASNILRSAGRRRELCASH